MNKGKNNKKTLVSMTLVSTLLLSSYSPVLAATASAPTTNTAAATTTAAYTVQPYTATGVVINSPYKLNMRLGPGTTYAIMGNLSSGQEVNITGKTSSWYRLKNGYFVSAGYIEIKSTPSYTIEPYTATGIVVNDTATDLKMRSGPGTSYAIEGTLSDGAQVKITGKSGSWYQLNNGLFVYSSYIHIPVITTKTLTETKAIPFQNVTVNDATKEQGYSQITQAGVNGVETITYTVTYSDNVETDRVISKDVVTTNPVNQVTTIGTKAPEPQVPKVTIADPTAIAKYTTVTTSQAIANYQKYMPSYLDHDQKIVDQFRAQETKSQADQLVERALWYMENGYSVYGHYWAGYGLYGITDCSNYVSMVYKDFGYSISTASRSYTNVGRVVQGVYSTVTGTNQYTGQKLYGIVGLDKLQPGDIFTYWAKDANGNKYISHVAIYMGMINGKPAVIGTTANRPTAVGIVDDMRYWYGSNLYDVRRVLPENAESVMTYTKKAPIIPQSYVLPPQKPIVMPQ